MMYVVSNCINLAKSFYLPEMSDSVLSALISTSVPAVISILGFIITILTVNKNFKNELSKSRSKIALDKMSKMPYLVLNLLDDFAKNKDNQSDTNVNEKVVNTYKELINTVFSYGSKEAIEIATLMQSESYQRGKTNENYQRKIALYILLAMQIKYDVTGIIISPDTYFSMKFNDYKDCKTKLKEETNSIVNQLHLNKMFKISD